MQNNKHKYPITKVRNLKNAIIKLEVVLLEKKENSNKWFKVREKIRHKKNKLKNINKDYSCKKNRNGYE